MLICVMQSYVQDNDDVKDTLSNPIIQDEKKKQVLSTIAREAGFTESTLSFLSLLVDARRIDAIDEIVEATRAQEENKAGGKIVVLT